MQAELLRLYRQAGGEGIWVRPGEQLTQGAACPVTHQDLIVTAAERKLSTYSFIMIIWGMKTYVSTAIFSTGIHK